MAGYAVQGGYRYMVLWIDLKGGASFTRDSWIINIQMSRNKVMELEAGEGTVMFLVKEKFWQSLNDYCRDAYRRTSDPFFVFWKAFAHYHLGSLNESINELLTIKDKKEISYACYVALIFYHGQTRNIDKEELDTLKAKQREERRLGADKAFIQAGYFYMFIGEWRRAEDLLEEKDSKSPAFALAKVWHTYFSQESEEFKPQDAQEAQKALEDRVEELFSNKDKVNPKIELFFIREKVLLKGKKYALALETVAEGLFFYSEFIPFMNEKCNCLIAVANWEQFIECAQEVISKDPENIHAVKCQAFNELARQGNIDGAFMKLKELESIIERKEGENAHLLYEISLLFSRICGRNPKIISLLQKFISKCRKMEPLNANYATELANQYLMLGDSNKAYELYQEASSLDETKVEAIAGMIECRISEGDIDDAEKQIQFVNVMQESIGRTPQIAYLEALLESKREGGPEVYANAAKFIDAALKMQIGYSKTLSPGFNFFIKLNPNLLFSLAELYLSNISMKEILAGNQNGSNTTPLGKGIMLLESITRQIPGFIPAYMLLARAKLAVGNESDAANSISQVLNYDPKNEEGYIMEAMTKKKRKEFEGALGSLNEAISHNFKIRENPLFMLIKGEIEYDMGDYTAAEQTAEQAYNLPSVKSKITAEPTKDVRKFKAMNFSEKDRCSVFLLLAKCYAKNKKGKETKAIMGKAIGEFSGTSEEVNVLLTNALISLDTGDVKKAISILKAVKSDSPYFIESRKLLADINLEHLKSRKGYARCFYEMIELDPSFENYKMYGDALMKIHEPEDASLAYEKAFELKSENESLIRDLGKAYSQSHDYDKAIQFYEKNITKLQKVDLELALAQLYIQLRRFEKAESYLNPARFADEKGENKQTFDTIKQGVEGYHTLYKLYLKKQGSLDCAPNENAKKALKKCLAYQQLAFDKAKSDSKNVQEEKKILADFFFELASYYDLYEKNNQQTIKSLGECLKCWPEHEKALELTGTIHLKSGDAEKAQRTCEILLKLSPKNDQASFILAEIMLKSNQYEKAIEQFKKILTEKPNNYPVLAKLIDFFRRNNKLEEAKSYMEEAHQKSSNANDSGLCFCRGLYNKFSRNPREALTQFNKAKKSTQYAQSSLVHMIDIYLNPDQDLYYSCIEQKVRTVDPQNIRVCESLLREMQSKASVHRYAVSEAYVQMMSGKSFNIEETTKRMFDILKNRSDYAPAMFAAAILKYIERKETEAKNFLKLVSKLSYESEYGEEIEKAWLLLAESFIKIQKYDNAEEILRMILKENKSCGKAEEFMGLIKEKEQAYVDAANHYDNAYKLTLSKSASIGYRLAFNYLKAKRFIECIEVCKNILDAFPNYPNLQKEVLEKAIFSLKGGG